MTFTFTSLSIQDVIHVKPHPHVDSRGFFMETYRRSEFCSFGITDDFVQDNRSNSKGPVLRGLHYQAPPKAQAKLISVTRGRVFDVAVDIRADSPTFGSWVGMVISSDNQEMRFGAVIHYYRERRRYMVGEERLIQIATCVVVDDGAAIVLTSPESPWCPTG